MRLAVIMKKLQRAILQKRLVIKINTRQFYSSDQDRMITLYILTTPVTHCGKHGEEKIKDFEILRTASGIDAVNCLLDIYKAVSTWV